jgi:hypothetical protein
MGEQYTMDLEERGWECVDWIDVVEDRGNCKAVVSSVMNLWVP